jgi:hypothetical protein
MIETCLSRVNLGFLWKKGTLGTTNLFGVFYDGILVGSAHAVFIHIGKSWSPMNN